MQARNWSHRFLLAGLALSMGACGTFSADQGPDLPERAGFYALYDEDELQRLDGSRDWELETWDRRSNFGPNVQFIVFEPALGQSPATFDKEVELQKVAWIRSDVDPSGKIRPATGSKWVVTDLPQMLVPISFTSIEGRSDAVHVVPQGPLEPGLYSIRMKAGGIAKTARIGVRWPRVDQASYSSAHCVDRYSGSRSFFRTCEEQSAGLAEVATDGLKIHLVDPQKRELGSKPVLSVSGVVVNTTDRDVGVPALRARVKDARGAVLKEWLFDAKASNVPPGGSVSFQTELAYPPIATSQVTVDFPPQSAGLK